MIFYNFNDLLKFTYYLKIIRTTFNIKINNGDPYEKK